MSAPLPVPTRPQNVDYAAIKRDAARERSLAMSAAWKRLAAWLWSGVALHYTDDAITHPAAGKPCGC